MSEDIVYNALEDGEEKIFCFVCEKLLYIGALHVTTAAVMNGVVVPVFTILLACEECHMKFIAPHMKTEARKVGCRLSFLAALDVPDGKPS